MGMVLAWALGLGSKMRIWKMVKMRMRRKARRKWGTKWKWRDTKMKPFSTTHPFTLPANPNPEHEHESLRHLGHPERRECPLQRRNQACRTNRDNQDNQENVPRRVNVFVSTFIFSPISTQVLTFLLTTHPCHPPGQAGTYP